MVAALRLLGASLLGALPLEVALTRLPSATPSSNRPAAPVVPRFSAPVLVGSSNSSTPNGSNFWFPGISIPTGIPGHVAQHITLAGDGVACPRPDHPGQSCEQIMLSADGGQSYVVTKRLQTGTSGNFNGYGDLGTWVPSKTRGQAPPGVFSTIVGCNGCPRVHHASSWDFPIFLQTWKDNGTTLSLIGNVSISFTGAPASFSSKKQCAGHACGFSSPSQTIVRTANDELLLAVYGHASDGWKNGSLYTTAYFSSADDGIHWRYVSRIDVTTSTPPAHAGEEGPCEPSMAVLADGRVLTALRHASDQPLWMAYSTNNGRSWGTPMLMRGLSPAGVPMKVYSVWPQLLVLSSGALILSSGRPGLGFWVSHDANGEEWIGYDICKEHSRLLPSDPFGSSSGTTSYTGLAEVEPNVVLLAYDKIGAGRVGAVQKVYSMRISMA